VENRLRRIGAAQLYEWLAAGHDSDDALTEDVVARLANTHDLTEDEVRGVVSTWKWRAGQVCSHV